MNPALRNCLRAGLAAFAIIALALTACTPMTDLATMTDQPRNNPADPAGTNPLGLKPAPTNLQVNSLVLSWRWPEGSANATNNTGAYQYFSLDWSSSGDGPWTNVISNFAIAMGVTYTYSPLAVGNYYRLAHTNGSGTVDGFYSDPLYCSL